MGEVDEHRLMRLTGPSIPSSERQKIIDSESYVQKDPLDPPIDAVHALRIDPLRRGVKRLVLIFVFDIGTKSRH
jgi:hypothetical protein